MKKPLIMATLADDRCTPDHVAAMVEAGMQGVRFNSAHASPDDIARLTAMVRAVDPRQVILVDTKGAEVRTTALAAGCDEVPVAEDARVTVIDGGAEPTTVRRFCITASGVCAHAREGMSVVVDDGAICMRVERVTPDSVECRVTKGGRLGSRKTVCFRGIELDALPAVTDRDRAAIEASIAAGVDIIAHSFVRSEADVAAVRALLADAPGVTLYSKIECPEAVSNMASILAASDGLLCARGDLGASCGLDRVPAVEMECIARCRKADKPVMVATQLMHTMMLEPSPTRAEAIDIGYAVAAGVDTLLLTGETARGHYPVQCVEWMRRIINTTHAYCASL